MKQSITVEDWQRINALLRQEWSPEEIGERLRMEGLRFVITLFNARMLVIDNKAGKNQHKILFYNSYQHYNYKK